MSEFEKWLSNVTLTVNGSRMAFRDGERAMARMAWNAALEAAANKCMELPESTWTEDVAVAIRALKEQSNG